MNVHELLRILHAIPEEYRGLPVVMEYLNMVHPLTVVLIDPKGTQHYDSPGVVLQSRVWRSAGSQRLYEAIAIPVPDPAAGVPEAPPID